MSTIRNTVGMGCRVVGTLLIAAGVLLLLSQVAVAQPPPTACPYDIQTNTTPCNQGCNGTVPSGGSCAGACNAQPGTCNACVCDVHRNINPPYNLFCRCK